MRCLIFLSELSVRGKHLTLREAEKSEAVYGAHSDTSRIENEKRTVSLADIVESRSRGDILAVRAVGVSEKDDIRALFVSRRDEARETGLDVVAMAVRHKYLLAFEFGKSELQGAVSAVASDKTVVFSVALNEDKGLFVMLGEGARKVAGTVAEMDEHIRIAVHFESTVHILVLVV